MISFFSKSERKFKKLKKRVEKSGLFDKVFYLKSYHDARVADATPVEHYCRVGIKEDRKPNADFDPLWYREFYIDVKNSPLFPFEHYIKFGRKENRFVNEAEKNEYESLKNSDFDEEFYKNSYEDLKKQDEKFCSVLHYIRHGKHEGRKTKKDPYQNKDITKTLEVIEKFFDEKSYLKVNQDVAKVVESGGISSGFAHFKNHGYDEVKKGQRALHENIPVCAEGHLVKLFKDIYELYKNKVILSPYDYFMETKYEDIIAQKIAFPSYYGYIYEEPFFTEATKKEIELFTYKPLLSVVIPVYNVDAKWLNLAIESVKNQWYKNWEICIADDKSTKEETINFLRNINDEKIKVKFLEQNQGISGASNEALKLASGEYIVLMDNDDEITPDAFYEVVKAINEKNAEFIYSDEDKIDTEGNFSDPYFKPDFSQDMFYAQNYLSHLGVIKRELVVKVGGWQVGFQGAQDYDLYLRVSEHTKNIVHIPKVLYHWRKILGSTAVSFDGKSYAQDAGKHALQNSLERKGIKASAENGNFPGTYRVSYELLSCPLVSIIIPFKDKPELLEMCVNSLLGSSYQNFEIIGVSNNSVEDATFAMMKSLEQKDSRISFCEYNIPFNYSKINNYAVDNYAKGEHILLLNNDIEILSKNWIEEMLMFSQREDVGCVGAKLYYPNDTIQHAGVIIGLGGVAGHSHKYFPKDHPGYFIRLNIVQNLSAVTAACLMIKKSIYQDLGGLNEQDLTVAFNDVDFCLRVLEKGYLNLFTPYAEAYHHESISRGHEDSPEKIERFQREVHYMKNRHNDIISKGDSYYNTNLTSQREDFSLNSTINLG
ncbi:MAG: hypothetical protein QG565_336 [Campylobacterota bacterium]|nr:hypothetical protein [Campylobacterota bacterium]